VSVVARIVLIFMAVFSSLSERLTQTFAALRNKGKLSAADVDGTVRDIRRALLESDVALEVVKTFTAAVRERALSDEVNTALNPAQQVVGIVNEELVAILGGNQRPLTFAKTPPTVIMLAGLQGSGKTTLAGKLARWLKDQGHTPVLIACDLQRPGAVKQLGIVAEQAGAAFFAPEPGDGVGDPVAVAKAGVKYAKEKNHDIAILDTAGRLGVDVDMMKQAAAIRKASDPDEVLFVIDAMIGQDAVHTAKAFQDGVDFTGVVLTKLDGDAKGGAALSVTGVTGRPVLFASTGEKQNEFDVFYPDRMASRILDLGDILTLIEQAQKTFDEEQTKEMEEKFRSETFSLDDFLGQLQQIKKMGSLSGMLKMLPGAGAMKDQIENVDEGDLVRTEAIIQSMTPRERLTPKVLNGSRRLRIASGSGTTVTEVNQLVVRFEQAAKMMKTVAKGGIPQLPGMGPIARGGGSSKKKAKKKTGSRSGNPATRAREVSGAPAPAEQGSSFGLGQK
jgi:signal recognition particle subunit SRP54